MKIKYLSIPTTFLATALVVSTASACPMANFLNKLFHVDPAKHACPHPNTAYIDNQSLINQSAGNKHYKSSQA